MPLCLTISHYVYCILGEEGASAEHVNHETLRTCEEKSRLYSTSSVVKGGGGKIYVLMI